MMPSWLSNSFSYSSSFALSWETSGGFECTLENRLNPSFCSNFILALSKLIFLRHLFSSTKYLEMSSLSSSFFGLKLPMF